LKEAPTPQRTNAKMGSLTAWGKRKRAHPALVDFSDGLAEFALIERAQI